LIVKYFSGGQDRDEPVKSIAPKKATVQDNEEYVLVSARDVRKVEISAG
jgi:hypothetical protein